MRVSLIAAVAANGTIGRNNDLPWRIRDDMRFFMRTTRGHVVITGRRNFDAMGKLKDRHIVVVSRSMELNQPDVSVARSIEQALRQAHARAETEAFVIGGAQVYALAFPYAHCFYRTRVLADVPGDVVMPPLDVSGWTREELGAGAAGSDNEHAFVIEKLTRPQEPQAY